MVGRGLAIALLVVACGGGTSVPDTETVCDDATDEDGDGLTDCDDSDCDNDPACLPMPEVCTGGLDEDGDTFVDCDDDDCWSDPACYQVDDPTDLDVALGDPSLDIDKSRATLANGTATFFLTFDAPWPPATTHYSWFAYFEIDNDGNTPVAGVTIQRHDGVDSIQPYLVPMANITIRQVPRGVWVRMVGVNAVGEKYYVETGIQKANPGTRVTDTVVGAPAPLP
jgi:hypothetical protein